MAHIPVLLNEILQWLNPRCGNKIVDATAGSGGHTRVLADRVGNAGAILAIEWDSVLAEQLAKKLKDEGRSQVIVVNESYVQLEELVKTQGWSGVEGVLFDLGLSSWHLEQSGRGFSFQKDEELDMRFNPNKLKLSALELINTWPEEKLTEILKSLGEEKYASAIARQIVQMRRRQAIRKTGELMEIIKQAIPKSYQRTKINPATKTFQALRMAVNQELANIEKGLTAALKILDLGGRLAVITFQGLEDVVVKKIFKAAQKQKQFKILTKNVIRPGWAEQLANRRSRSAKLRVIEKVFSR